MKAIFFVAMLFLFSASTLMLGGIALYETIDFHFNGRPAQMSLPEGKKPLSLPVGGYDVHLIDVQYSGPDGVIRVPQKQLVGPIARKVAAGEKIPVTYMKNNPARVYYAGEKPDNPWVPLILAVVSLPVALYARKRLHVERGDE